MKLLLTALSTAFLSTSLSFAGSCDKCDGDKDKEESTSIIAHCGGCEKDHDKEKEEEKKEEGTLLAGQCPESGECDGDEEGTLA